EHQHGGDAHHPTQVNALASDHLRPAPPLGDDGGPHGITRRRGRRLVVLPRFLTDELHETLLGILHASHAPANSASASRSFARARDSWAFDVPVSVPMDSAISSCV